MTQDADFSALAPPFKLGVGTSAYQIEGAVNQDGRGKSIWDVFTHTPGKTKDGTNGDVACDHYNRLNEDLDLLQWMHVDGYRFSISWPRIVPEGVGSVNEKGLDFYERLVDGLLARDITPYPTLYHWDLPAALESEGGWLNRATCHAFEQYAVAVARRLGDRVPMWFTHNEPWCQAFLGYEHGIFAPGVQNFADALQCAHHLLLSHGMAATALRSVVNTPIGPALNFTPSYPGSDKEEDIEAAQRQNGYFQGWFVDPIAGRGYPEHMVRHYGKLMPSFRSADLDVIAAPIDVLGVNYYERSLVVNKEGDEGGVLQLEHLQRPLAHTADREMYPPGLSDTLRDLHFNYGFNNLMITENGAAFEETPDETGYVDDAGRIDFIKAHLNEVIKVKAEGVPVNGYFAWTLMDNYEWNEGYSLCYGLCHMNKQTFKRTPKTSAHFLRRLRAK
ncbi:MAG: beta-glucosidase [Deltaproteobacteria bacterium]|nr:beta-glucosidase [Deltaproteobacteria bacterium]MBN2671570.1 beta-glucosidase [Deltaproteobacteria bacterium]